jgi:hypothetical protein
VPTERRKESASPKTMTKVRMALRSPLASVAEGQTLLLVRFLSHTHLLHVNLEKTFEKE